MKTQSQDKIKIAKTLYKLVEDRKRLEKEEKELKDKIKLIMGSEKVLEADNIIILLDERERTDLDKKKMVTDLGMDLIKQYETKSTYQIMTIKEK